MKIVIPNVKNNPVDLFRRAGYIFQHSNGDEMSFVMPFSRSGFPRFHAYVSLKNSDLVFNIHLDQKKETYGNSTRHHGEYKDNKIVAEEVERLKNILK